MRKLHLIALAIWSALAFAVATKPQVNKPYGDWFKLTLRVVQQQPLPADLGQLLHAFHAFDPGCQWLQLTTTLVA